MTLEPLTTARLALTPISKELAQRMLAGDLSSVQVASGWPHEDTMDGLRMTGAGGPPPVWLVLHEGAVIGDCGLHGRPDAKGGVEIGYGLAADWRGQGFGTEVVQVLAGWLLDQPGISVVRAHTLPDNVASRRVLEKAGFCPRGLENGELLFERSAVQG